MSKMTEFEINGVKIELYYNVAATIGISELCGGDIANLPKLLEKNTVEEQLNLICSLLCELANGAVALHNTNISFGLETGKPKPEYTVQFFKAQCGIDDVNNAFSACLEAMGLGSEFTVPDNVKTAEEDIDLAEIEAEKNETKKS